MKAIMIILLLYIDCQLTNHVVQKFNACKYAFVNFNHVISAMSTFNLDTLVNYKSQVIA